jgi:RecA-family ATPase
MTDHPGDGDNVLSIAPYPYRRPPHDLDAERAVLGAVLVNNQAYERCLPLRPDNFAAEPHRVIWQAMTTIIAGARIADPITLANHWQGSAILDDLGGRAYLMTLADAAVKVVNAGEYARIIRDAATRRELIGVIEAAAEQAHGYRGAGGESAALIASQLSRQLEALQQDTDGDDGLALFNPASLDGVEPKPRAWLVGDWIPMKAVSALYGPGGGGKSLLAQMLSSSVATGHDWLGLPVRRGRVIHMACEDDLEELHRRQARINTAYAIGCRALEDVRWAERFGQSNYLMVPGHAGGELTPLFDQLLRASQLFGADLIILDTAAHTFGGLELDRGQVTEFIAHCCGRLAMATGAAVLLCAHPPKDGKQYSGSTAWDASVRSRLYLDRVGEDGDENRRVLSRAKANYAAGTGSIDLAWTGPDGILEMTRSNVAAAVMDVNQLAEIDTVVGQCIGDLVARGCRPRESNKAGNQYAVVMLKTCHELAGYGTDTLEKALFRCTRAGGISICEERVNGRMSTFYGPPEHEAAR